MTKEEKELLFKELCSRLPYGLEGVEYIGSDKYKLYNCCDPNLKKCYWANLDNILSGSRIDCKPLLFPLTRERIEEILHNIDFIWFFGITDHGTIHYSLNKRSRNSLEFNCFIDYPETFPKWLLEECYKRHINTVFPSHLYIDKSKVK